MHRSGKLARLYFLSCENRNVFMSWGLSMSIGLLPAVEVESGQYTNWFL